MVIVFRNYKKDFSLPTQRCFSGALQALAEGSLFSAYAEAFLIKALN